MPNYTVCQFCAGRPTHVAGQRGPDGEMDWVLVCEAHAAGWADDPEAPIYSLRDTDMRSPTYSYKAKLALRSFSYKDYSRYLEEVKRLYPGGSLST